MKTMAYADRLQRLGGVVFDMERHGVPISREVCSEIAGAARRDEADSLGRLNDLAQSLAPGAGAPNWNYPLWLVEFLHAPAPRGLGLTPSPYWGKGKVKTWQGERKVDGTALDYLAAMNEEYRALLNLVRVYRQQHRMGTYAEGWLELAVPHPDGSWRLHPSFGMADDGDARPGAKTGRFGIKNPALQQVPKDPRKDPYRLRRAFIATPGHRIVVADYTQLEIVILAHICHRLFGATGLLNRLLPGQPDMHSSTAQYVFGSVLGTPEVLAATDLSRFKSDPVLARFRDLVKRIRYGLAYGKGDYGFGNTLFELNLAGDIIGPPIGEERAGVLKNALLDMDPEVRAYQEWIWQYGRKTQMMPSLQGRWSLGPEILSKEVWRANRRYRQWLNWPMQAGGQEIVIAAMLELAEAGLTMSLQVHDELHFMVPEDDVDRVMPMIQYKMEHATTLDSYQKAVPAAGDTWEEAHK